MTTQPTAHCKICSLHGEHPGVSLGPEQVCNICKLEVSGAMLENVAHARAAYAAFESSPSNPDGHDCMVMFSGGKDSTYILDRLVNAEGRRVLAYTFDVPFESAHAADNVRTARARIPATFVVDRDDEGIKKLMRHVFNRHVPDKPGRYLDEKFPCISCRTFFVIRAILYARERKIPFIVFCADPQQTLTVEPSVREVVRGFYRSFGRELTAELFGDRAEEVLFAREDELPRMVFPFAAGHLRYDPDRIVAELKEKGLYASSPLETHCTLFPLLNYYSFRHWDCMFYKLNAASSLRAATKGSGTRRSTFGIRFPPDADLPALEARLKEVLFEIAAGEGDAGRQEAEIVAIFRQLDAGEEAARFVARSFLAMPEVAADMGIELG